MRRDNEVLAATNTDDAADIDQCQAMIWRLTLLAEASDTHHHDEEPPPHEDDLPPHDLWDLNDPGTATQNASGAVGAVRNRLDAEPSTEGPWTALAEDLDPRLTREPDWRAAVWVLDEAKAAGFDVEKLARELVADDPLSVRPAQDLRYRIAAALPPEVLAMDMSEAATTVGSSAPEKRLPPSLSPDVPEAPRR